MKLHLLYSHRKLNESNSLWTKLNHNSRCSSDKYKIRVWKSPEDIFLRYILQAAHNTEVHTTAILRALVRQ